MAQEKTEKTTDEVQNASAAETGAEVLAADEICMPEDEISKVLSALADKNRLLEEHTERYIRLQADFDNFRRRTRQEKEELSIIVAQGIVMQFLPVLDNFERALSLSGSAAQGDGLRTGVEMICRQFAQVFEKLGVEPVAAVGAQFDPQLHEAVMSVEDAEKPDGTIAEELQKGYLLKGKVIRPSMVKVVKNN